MVLEGHGNEIFSSMYRHARMCPRTIRKSFTDAKDASRTIKTGFTDRFVVSHALREVTRRFILTDKSIYKATWFGFCLYTFCISMRIDQFNNFSTDTGDI